MYKKSFLTIFLLLNIMLLNFLIFSNDISKIYIIFNIFLTITSITIFSLYLLNITKKKTLLSIGFFLSFYGILNISGLLSAYIINFLTIFFKEKDNIFSYYYILNIFIELFLVFNIYYLFYKEDIGKQFSSFRNKNIDYYNYIVLFYLIGFSLNFLFSSIANFIPLAETTPANQEGIEIIMKSIHYKYLYIFDLVLLGPIIEEFFFRYILIQEILYKMIKNDKKLKRIIIILLSGFIFAFFHAIAAESFIYFIRDILLYIGTSLALSIAYIKTNNIFVGYFVHVLNNLIAVIIMINIK